MISTLILTLSGPMQYWPSGSGPRQSRTSDHPTKCAVTGLVANALGRDFADPIDDLAQLKFAVSTVRPGTIEVDYRTAGTVTYPALPGDVLSGIELAEEVDYAGRVQVVSTPRKNPMWSKVAKESLGAAEAGYAAGRQRWEEFLADAEFRVALTGDTDLLTRVHQALLNPARGLFFGRRAFSPTGPLVGPESLNDGELVDSMGLFDHGGTLWIEVRPGTPGAQLVEDQPVSFKRGSQRRRRAEIIRPSLGENHASDLFATAME